MAFKTANGDKIRLRHDGTGEVNLVVGDQVVAWYNPTQDRWFRLSYVSEKVGMRRVHRDDQTSPVAFKRF